MNIKEQIRIVSSPHDERSLIAGLERYMNQNIVDHSISGEPVTIHRSGGIVDFCQDNLDYEVSPIGTNL